jgi:flagellin
VQNGHVNIASLATGAGASVTIAAGNANAGLGFTAGTKSGTAADLGFGVTGSTFAIGNTATAAPAVPVQLDSGGANQTSSLSFAPITDGNDTQTVSISALDSSGVTHSLSTLLQNNATSRSGQSLDSAINSINTALQQSNDSTLQSIVAVKENVGGTEKIGFLSGTASFKVSIGTTANSTGIGSQGTTAASTVTNGGSTANISTQAGALAAVNVLANSVSLLGTAQAVVGRGENQFNYAINLAQSQLTNLTSAEATIRDADLASQAANLTKAQILLQAGVAALAQANSAPQAVLSLLKG